MHENSVIYFCSYFKSVYFDSPLGSLLECAHLMRKILLGVGNGEIGMSTNIVPITLQVALIGFFPMGILSFLKMPVNLNQYRGTVGTFNSRNYYHKLTLSLEHPCQSAFFLNCVFPLCKISFLFVLLISVFLTLKSNSYRSTKHFYTLSFLLAIITIWSLPWLYSLLILLSVDVELNPGPKHVSASNISICHWNLNSISVHKYTKLFLLKAYIAVHKFDIICLSETYFNSSKTKTNLKQNNPFLIVLIGI